VICQHKKGGEGKGRRDARKGFKKGIQRRKEGENDGAKQIVHVGVVLVLWRLSGGKEGDRGKAEEGKRERKGREERKKGGDGRQEGRKGGDREGKETSNQEGGRAFD
jgi:hypothetical protein